MPINPYNAVGDIEKYAPHYAKAKADRVHIENFLRVVKSRIFLKQDEGTQGAKEAVAYAHPDYVQQVDALKIATENEERLKYLIDAAKLKVEIFKTEEFTKRVEMKNL